MPHPLVEAMHREAQRRDVDNQLIQDLTTQLCEERARNAGYREAAKAGREASKLTTRILRTCTALIAAYESGDDQHLDQAITRLNLIIHTNSKGPHHD